jgi:hypothetical protein
VVLKADNNKPWRNHPRYKKQYPPKKLAKQQPARGQGEQAGPPPKGARGGGKRK